VTCFWTRLLADAFPVPLGAPSQALGQGCKAGLAEPIAGDDEGGAKVRRETFVREAASTFRHVPGGSGKGRRFASWPRRTPRPRTRRRATNSMVAGLERQTIDRAGRDP